MFYARVYQAQRVLHVFNGDDGCEYKLGFYLDVPGKKIWESNKLSSFNVTLAFKGNDVATLNLKDYVTIDEGNELPNLGVVMPANDFRKKLQEDIIKRIKDVRGIELKEPIKFETTFIVRKDPTPTEFGICDVIINVV